MPSCCRPQQYTSKPHIWIPVLNTKSVYPRYSGLKLTGQPGVIKLGTWHCRSAAACRKLKDRMRHLGLRVRVTSGTCLLQPGLHPSETGPRSGMIVLDPAGASG